MGIISLEKADNLYWLGRYSERVFTTLKVFYEYYDKMLDEEVDAYKMFCDRLGLPDVYGSTETFLTDYLYDSANPDSVCTSISRAYGNAITMREEIGTNALGYIQMSMNHWQVSKVEDEKYLSHQKLMDYLYAFWGCIDDEVEDEDHRNIIKVGRYVERLDLCMRLKVDQQLINKAFRKLKDRIQRLSRPYDDEKLFRLGEILKMEDWTERAGEALMYVNSLFEVPVE